MLNRGRLEDYITDSQFLRNFRMTRGEYAELPFWRQCLLKKRLQLFWYEPLCVYSAKRASLYIEILFEMYKICRIWCILHNAHCTMHNVHMICIVHSTTCIYSAYYRFNNADCTQYFVQAIKALHNKGTFACTHFTHRAHKEYMASHWPYILYCGTFHTLHE